MSTIKELKKLMNKYLTDIETAIKNIHQQNGVDNETVIKEITDAVNNGLVPVQGEVTALQTRIADLEQALRDTALGNGDTVTAQAKASAAVNDQTNANTAASQTAQNLAASQAANATGVNTNGVGV